MKRTAKRARRLQVKKQTIKRLATNKAAGVVGGFVPPDTEDDTTFKVPSAAGGPIGPTCPGFA